MKKTLVALGFGASVLVALSACRNSDANFTGNEYTVASGEIPPWLLDGDESEQVYAGATTQNRNDMIFPDETGAMADINPGGASSQVQPEHLADSPPPPTDEVPFNETPVHTDPLAGGPQIAVNTPPVTGASKQPVTAPKPTPVKPKTPAKQNKPKQKFTEPTLITYTVRKGDNLYDIAKRSRTTVAQIKKDSKLKKDTIYPGQVIKVRYIPKGYKPGQESSSSSSAKSRYHVVAKGETISGIAKKYGVLTTQVLKANNMSLSDAAKIRPGKRLTIPAATKKK